MEDDKWVRGPELGGNERPHLLPCAPDGEVIPMSSHGKAGKLAVSSAEDGPLPHAELRKAGVDGERQVERPGRTGTSWVAIRRVPAAAKTSARSRSRFVRLRSRRGRWCAALQGGDDARPAVRQPLEARSATRSFCSRRHGLAPPATLLSVRCAASPRLRTRIRAAAATTPGASTAKKLSFTQSITEARYHRRHLWRRRRHPGPPPRAWHWPR